MSSQKKNGTPSLAIFRTDSSWRKHDEEQALSNVHRNWSMDTLVWSKSGEGLGEGLPEGGMPLQQAWEVFIIAL